MIIYCIHQLNIKFRIQFGLLGEVAGDAINYSKTVMSPVDRLHMA